MTQKEFNFDYEFQNKLGEIGDLEDKLRREADTRLRKLAQGHTDLTGASVILEREDQDATTMHQIRARVVAYTRPEYIAGVEKADTAQGALKGALDAVERQVRQKREKLRESHR